MSKIQSILLTLFVALAVSLAVSYHSGSRDQASQASKQSVYDRVTSSGVLRCGYAIYQPSFFVEPNSKSYSGILYEVTTKLTELLQLKVEWTEEVPYSQMGEALDAGRFDMVCSGKWVYAYPGAAVDYSLPIFLTAVNVYTNAGDTRFDDDLQKLNAADKTIAIMDGTATADIARSEFPLAKTIAIPAMNNEAVMVMNVTTGKADATFVDQGVAQEFLAANPNSIHNATSRKPLRIFETAFMFPADEKFAAMINTALRQMHNEGFIDRTLQKYEKTSGAFYRVAKPYRD